MHRRGRDPDASPLALTPAAHREQHPPHPRLSRTLPLPPQSNLREPQPAQGHSSAFASSRHPPCYKSQPLRYTLPPQPVASSSRTDPSPPFSHSHSSTASTSPEPTPAPATPPELADEPLSSFPVHCHKHKTAPIPIPAADMDYWESPPSPPRSLKDQMHVAYAHDNFRLAKILLLKLKGIDVADEHDPRIDEVTDADFESAFVPRGGFKLDEEAQRRCVEGERREKERLRRRAQEARLRRCERIWEESARCMREERVRAMRRKEEQTRMRRRAEIEAREREAREREREREEREQCRYVLHGPHASRAVLSYGDLPASTSRAQPSTSRSPPQPRTIETGPLFEYAIMPPVPASRPRAPGSSSSSNVQGSPNRALRELAALSAPGVPFAEVVRSMRGALFAPDDVAERARRRRSAAQVDLLDALLDTSPWDARVAEASRSGSSSRPPSGTGVRGGSAQRGGPEAGSAPSAAESSSAASSSMTVLSRSLSWFSFGSRASSTSKQSVSTALTTPAVSPVPPSKLSAVFQSPSSASASASSTVVCSPLSHESRRRHTHTPRTHCIPVPPQDHPLSTCTPRSNASFSAASGTDTLCIARGRPLTRRALSALSSPSTSASASSASPPASPLTNTLALLNGGGLVQRISRSMSSFLDAAAQLHRAYVRATVFAASQDLYYDDDLYDCEYEYGYHAARSRSSSRSRARSRTVTRDGSHRARGTGAPLRPAGYRATCEDVFVFISTVNSSSTTDPNPQRAFIPLEHTLASSSLSSPSSSTTPPRVFAPAPPLPRSPFRQRAPPARLTSRLRPIANPLMLRLRALENAYGNVQSVREIREKIVGVAWEGIGRSGLVREVRPCAAGAC